MQSTDLRPTEQQRLEFARTLVRSGRLNEGDETHPYCIRCRRPMPMMALDYLRGVVRSALDGGPLTLFHSRCGMPQAVKPQLGGVA